MTRLDMIAAEPQYVDHIAPVWAALPDDLRGAFVTSGEPARARAHAHGIVPGNGDVARPVLVAASGDLKRARRAGRPWVALMEHGAGQSYGGDPRSADHSSYAGGANRSADLFLHPGPHPASRDRARYPAVRVEVIGCPRLDLLPARDPGDPTIAVTFHWDALVSPETRSGFVAFRADVQRLATRHHLIGHAHPRFMGRISSWYRRHGIEVVGSLDEVCRRADLLIADNTSAMFEFAATGRPVVVMDPPSYRRHIHHGLRFWEAATVGLQARPGELASVVEAAIGDPADVRQARETALGLVYAHRTGGAERAAAVLDDWLREIAAPRTRRASPAHPPGARAEAIAATGRAQC